MAYLIKQWFRDSGIIEYKVEQGDFTEADEVVNELRIDKEGEEYGYFQTFLDSEGEKDQFIAGFGPDAVQIG